MSEIDDREITEIIERVRRRVAAAGDERPGAGLRAEAALTAVDTAELGDGIHATIDEAVAAATQAFRARISAWSSIDRRTASMIPFRPARPWAPKARKACVAAATASSIVEWMPSPSSAV